jgi:hypothetical protein
MDEFIRREREHKERFTSDNFDWGAENNEAKCSSKIIKLESERREFITTLLSAASSRLAVFAVFASGF